MIHFRAIIGNHTVKDQLQLLLEKSEVPHLLLFTGVEGIGKRLFAKAFASAWLQKKSDNFQPDLHLFAPEGKTGMHSIRQVKRLLDEINLAPYGEAGKAFVIEDAERMLPSSSNALLKTLEEPPKNTLIILVSSEPQKLLATIVSRCQEVRFCPCDTNEIAEVLVRHHGFTESQASLVALQSKGSIGKAVRLGKSGTNELEELLFAFLSMPHRSFVEVSKTAKALQQLFEGRKKNYHDALKEEHGQSLKEFNASQKEVVEQEMEGALSLAYFRDCYELFSLVQSYFRDLVALSCHAPLHLPHRKEALVEAFNRGQSISLEHLERILGEAKQALERATPLQNVLESLFLRL